MKKSITIDFDYGVPPRWDVQIESITIQGGVPKSYENLIFLG